MNTNQNKFASFRVDSRLICAFPITAIPAITCDDSDWPKYV